MRWRDCIDRDVRKAELGDMDWRMVAQDRGQWRRVVHRRQRRVATLTPEIRETRKRERDSLQLFSPSSRSS